MSGPFAGPPGGVPVRSFSIAESSILSLGKNASELAFFSRLIRTLAMPKILPLGKMQVNLLLPSLIRTLASPKILRLGKNASELAFFSRLIRIFAGTETVPMLYVAKYSQDQDRRTARDLLRRNSPPPNLIDTHRAGPAAGVPRMIRFIRAFPRAFCSSIFSIILKTLCK